MTAIAQNAHRHRPNWANRPPNVGPSNVPMPNMADANPAARVHSRSGSATLIIVYPRPVRRPPPNPCKMRPITSNSIVGLSALTIAPRPNPRKPMVYAVVAPRLPRRRLTNIDATIAAVTKPVMVHCIKQDTASEHGDDDKPATAEQVPPPKSCPSESRVQRFSRLSMGH